MWPKIFGYASKHLGWAKSILSEKGGSGSASRIVLFTLVLTVCGVLIYSVVIHHELPSRDVLLGLSSLASVGAAGYGANVLSHKDDNKQETNIQATVEAAPVVVDTGADNATSLSKH